jgi:hypothetical protein
MCVGIEDIVCTRGARGISVSFVQACVCVLVLSVVRCVERFRYAAVPENL